MSSFVDIANEWVSGLPVYEPGRPIEEVARELGFDDVEQIVKLASNENPLGPSPMALQAIHDHAGRMHVYPDGGAFYFKRKIADKLSVHPSMIVPGNGSNELLEFIGHIFAGPGRDIVMADRAFIVYRLIAALFRSNLIAVPMKEHTHDLDAMLNAVRDSTRIVFIANPNNPTGTMVAQDQLDSFMDRIPDHVVVCFDEAYIDLIDPAIRPDTLKYVRDDRNVIVLRTFSKTYGLAGLRIGYAVAPESCTALLNRVRQPFNVNAMAMAAAIAAVDDEEHLENFVRLIADGTEYLYGEFDRLGLEYVRSVANFILVKTGSGRKVFELLQKKGVIARPMDVYGMPDHIRLTIGTADQNRTAAERLAEVMNELRGL